MPIKIYQSAPYEEIAWFCENSWELPIQVYQLEQWLKDRAPSLPIADYVIDIGFDVRPQANGGGAVITIELMKMMAEKGFSLFLSEYPDQLG